MSSHSNAQALQGHPSQGSGLRLRVKWVSAWPAQGAAQPTGRSGHLGPWGLDAQVGWWLLSPQGSRPSQGSLRPQPQLSFLELPQRKKPSEALQPRRPGVQTEVYVPASLCRKPSRPLAQWVSRPGQETQIVAGRAALKLGLTTSRARGRPGARQPWPILSKPAPCDRL